VTPKKSSMLYQQQMLLWPVLAALSPGLPARMQMLLEDSIFCTNLSSCNTPRLQNCESRGMIMAICSATVSSSP
jgi:hypothetical protein